MFHKLVLCCGALLVSGRCDRCATGEHACCTAFRVCLQSLCFPHRCTSTTCNILTSVARVHGAFRNVRCTASLSCPRAYQALLHLVQSISTHCRAHCCVPHSDSPCILHDRKPPHPQKSCVRRVGKPHANTPQPCLVPDGGNTTQPMEPPSMRVRRPGGDVCSPSVDQARGVLRKCSTIPCYTPRHCEPGAFGSCLPPHAGADGQIKVWDVRLLKPMHSYFAHSTVTSLEISQRGLLAVGYGRRVQVGSPSRVMRAPGPGCWSYPSLSDVDDSAVGDWDVDGDVVSDKDARVHRQVCATDRPTPSKHGAVSRTARFHCRCDVCTPAPYV